MARSRVLPSDPAFPHGIATGVSRGCTDEASCPGNEHGVTCRQALRDYQNNLRAKKSGKAELKMTPPAPVDAVAVERTFLPPAPDPEQATPLLGDRIDAEVEAIADEANRELAPTLVAPKPAPAKVEGMTAARGTTRRLQALCWMGYTPVELAHHTQISVDAIWWLLFSPPEQVKDVTHRVIVNTFQKLREQPKNTNEGAPGWSTSNARIRDLAAARKWAGPYAWENIDSDPEPERTLDPGVGTRGREQQVKDKKIAKLEKELETANANLASVTNHFTKVEASPPVRGVPEFPGSETSDGMNAYQLANELNTAHTRAADLEEQLTDRAERIKSLEEDLSHHRDALLASSEDLADLQKRLEEVHGTSTQLTAHSAEIIRLEHDLAVTIAELLHTGRLLEGERNKHETTRNELADLETQHDVLEVVTERKLGEQQKTIAALREVVDQHARDYDVRGTDVAAPATFSPAPGVTITVHVHGPADAR